MGVHRRYKPRNFDFGNVLATLRRRTGLTQEEMAIQLDIGVRSIRNWEGGSHYPTEIHMQKLIELCLHKHLFIHGQEQEEAHTLWEQLQANTPRRVSGFDEAWFADLLTRWQNQEGNQQNGQEPDSPHALPASPDHFAARSSSRLLRGDWSAALDVSNWYGRIEELATLSHWLLEDHCRLVSILGMGGIGKTSLAVKLVQLVAPHFDCLLWRSLHNAPPLEEVVRDWLGILNASGEVPMLQDDEQGLALLIGHLQEQRCLLVLDNLETLFQHGTLEGRAQAGYEGYLTLIRRVAETTHRSCLLLTSRELPPEVGVAAGQRAPVRVFRLGGLEVSACQYLLEDKELVGEPEAWRELVQRYAGNPLALKIVAETVRDLFGGDMAAFLAKGLMTFQGIRQLLTQQVDRLSDLEQALLYWLAIEREWTTLEMLEADLWPARSTGEVLEALYSLRSRNLIERGERGAVFTLQPVVLEYMTERLVERVSEEIRECRPELLLRHSLLQARAREYVRASQAQLLLQPVLTRLLAHSSDPPAGEAHLERVLEHLRTLPRAVQGYGGGNVVNLLVRLNGHLRGKDCSQLTIWQADLQGVDAQDASFAGADLTGSVFLEPLDGIVSVAFHPGGEVITAGTDNGQIHVWRAADGQPLIVLPGHQKKAWSLVFTPEGDRLISGGYDGLVKVWDLESGQCVQVLQGHTRWLGLMALHPEGRLLATGSDDQSIRLWDLSTGECLASWHEHREIWAVAFSPDGQWLCSGYRDGTIKLWDHVRAQCVWSTAAHRGLATQSLAFSPDGLVLASAGEDATIMLWHVSTGKHLGTLTGHTDIVLSVAFNAQGLLASSSADCTVKVWQLDQGSETGKAAQCVDTLSGHTNIVWSIAFSPDGLLASSSFDCTVKLWQINQDGRGGRCLRTLHGYTHLVSAIAFSPDSQLLISTDRSRTVKIWETASGQCLHTSSQPIGEFSALAFRPDGRLFAQGLLNRTIKLWEVERRQWIKTLRGHEGQIIAMLFSPDGRLLLSASLDKTIRMWEVESGRCLTIFQGHQNWVWSLACNSDGRLLASGDYDGMVKLWEIESGTCLHTLPGSPNAILALVFTSDNNRLLASNEQGLVMAWDVRSGERLGTILETGEAYWLGSMAFSVDGSFLATASSDQMVKLWDLSRGALARSFSCHAGQPLPVAFSADQHLLAGGTDDGTILLWEWRTGEYRLTLRSDRPYERMNISGASGITPPQRASLRALGASENRE